MENKLINNNVNDQVKFQMLTIASIRKKVFRDIAPCSVTQANRRLRRAYSFRHYGDDSPDDGGSMTFWIACVVGCL
jgi:hypothetical protein